MHSIAYSIQSDLSDSTVTVEGQLQGVQAKKNKKFQNRPIIYRFKREFTQLFIIMIKITKFITTSRFRLKLLCKVEVDRIVQFYVGMWEHERWIISACISGGRAI